MKKVSLIIILLIMPVIQPWVFAQSKVDYVNRKVEVGLQNGRRIEGKVVEQTEEGIKLEVLGGAGTIFLSKDSIERIALNEPIPPPADKPKEMKAEELKEFISRSKRVGSDIIESSKIALDLSNNISKLWEKKMRWSFHSTLSSEDKPLGYYDNRVEGWYKDNQATVSELNKRNEEIKNEVDELGKIFYGSSNIYELLKALYTAYEELSSLALNPAGYSLGDYRTKINTLYVQVTKDCEAFLEY